MKRIFTLLCFLFLSHLFAQSHKKYTLPVPSENVLLDFCINDNSAYFIVQNEHNLIKSDLKFENFDKKEIVANGINIDFQEAVNCDHGKLFVAGDRLINGGLFAGGSQESTIFESSDDGDSWNVNVPEGTLSLSAQKMIYKSDMEFFAMVSPGNGTNELKHTIDGGKNWNNLYTADYHYMNISESKFHKLVFTDGVGQNWKLGYINDQFEKFEHNIDGYKSIKFIKEDENGNFEIILDKSKYYRLSKDFTSLEFLHDIKYHNFYIDENGRFWQVDQKYIDGKNKSQLFWSNDNGRVWKNFEIWIDSLFGFPFMIKNNTIYTAHRNELHVFSDISLSNADLEVGEIKLPNPFADEILIENYQNFKNFQLIDGATGRTIINQPVYSEKISINGVQNGFYILKLTDSNQKIFLQKVIKNI